MRTGGSECVGQFISTEWNATCAVSRCPSTSVWVVVGVGVGEEGSSVIKGEGRNRVLVDLPDVTCQKASQRCKSSVPPSSTTPCRAPHTAPSP